MRFFKAATLSFAYVLVLLTTYYLHVRFGRVDVVLYGAIQDALLAAVVVGLALLAIPMFRIFSALEKCLLIAVWLLGGYCFAISVPTVIDRSLSFYILEKLHQRGGGIRMDRMTDVFTKEYVVEDRLVDVRLTEQLESGTISIVDGCVHLTPRGLLLARMSGYFRSHFLPRQRLLMGRYSDDLTDPFRHSIEAVDYTCK